MIPFRLLPVIARSRNDKIEKALFWVFAGRLPIHDIYTGRERGVLHFDRGRVGKHWALDFDFRQYSRARRWTEGEGGVVFFPRGEAETGASVDLSSFPYKRKCARSKIGKISVAKFFERLSGSKVVYTSETGRRSGPLEGEEERRAKLKHVSGVIEGNAARNSFHGFRKR